MTLASKIQKKLITQDPFGPQRSLGFYREGLWPARWISHPEVNDGSAVVRYRLKFQVDEPTQIDFHVTADERYEIFWNGVRFARGPERCTEDHWAFESFNARLEPGSHEIQVLVWSAADLRAFATHTIRHGLLLAAEGDFGKVINTGTGTWTAEIDTRYQFISPGRAWGTGGKIRFNSSAGTSTPVPAKALHPGLIWNFESEHGRIHLLRPATLPEMYEAKWNTWRVRHAREIPEGETHPIIFEEDDNSTKWFEAASQLREGKSLTVPAGVRVRVLLDMGNYVCARNAVSWLGRGSIRIHWQESLFLSERRRPNDWREMHKGHRDEIDGKRFTEIWSWRDGVGDTVIADSSGAYESLWWHAGRYVELVIQGGEGGITLETLIFTETHYPYQFEDRFECSDSDLAPIHKLGKRSLEMCSHETYMDCPYYEQLQYVGDTRLQVLVTYATCTDHRLPIQALEAFDTSRRTRGITHSRYPSYIRQVIPTFSLWWVCMVHDAMMYQADFDIIKKFIPGCRSVLDYFDTCVDSSGLIHPPAGWNFIDWVKNWPSGWPPRGNEDPTAPLNLQVVLARRALADLENAAGEALLSKRSLQQAESLSAAIRRHFYHDSRLWDDLTHEQLSEHSQCLGYLAGVLSDGEFRSGLMASPKQKTTIYFRHYLFEALWKLGDGDGILDELDTWRWHLKNGLFTTIEHPEPTRSDCHAWGAHPIYHSYASLLGIRPTSAGFRTVLIRPAATRLPRISGTTPTPHGPITVEVDRTKLKAEIPNGITGTIVFAGKSLSVGSGRHEIHR
jgi:hypothetical protein